MTALYRMKQFVLNTILLCLLGGTTAGRITAEEIQISRKSKISEYNFNVGVGRVNITPEKGFRRAGSPLRENITSVSTPLYVRAIVIDAGKNKLAIVTLDHLKYPANLVVEASKKIEQTTGILTGNIVICASHTHSGPLFSYYEDRLVRSIVDAVTLAVDDLTPCKIGTSAGKVEGVSANRRLLKDGECWNAWLVNPPSERDQYPALGPIDPEVTVLAVVSKEGRYKAILYNYVCHPVSNPNRTISADYPGHVERRVEEILGYQVPTLFLQGPSGDVMPKKRNAPTIGIKLGDVILKSLENIEFIADPTIHIVGKVKEVPGREHPVFNEEEISIKWRTQLEHYRKAFKEMKHREKPAYQAVFTGIRIGDEFALITNPVELFCQIGLDIKNDSTFNHTMIATLTNGALGYVPTAKSFEKGGYETWYGEHSFLSKRAGEIIKHESMKILEDLKKEDQQ